MEGAELSARFALPPNSRSYCGTRKFADVFAAYLGDRSAKNLVALERALSSFRAHYAYLKMIAGANGRKQFDAKVTEALWLGNGLLKKVKRKDLQRMITSDFVGKGMLGAKRAEGLAVSLNGRFVAHHSFHTLYIHSITGVVPPTVKTSDNCRVGWGRVVKAREGAAIVKTQKLVRKGGKLLLLPCKKKWKLSCAGIELLQGVKKGELVASHWGVAVMKITKGQAARLEKATLQNMKAANRK